MVWYGANDMQIFAKKDEAVGSGIDKPDPQGLGQKMAAGLRSLLKEDDAPSDTPRQDGGPIAIDAELVRHAGCVIRKLREMDVTLVTAESCTAGFIAAVLSQAEGAGDVLHGGFVTYIKENKTAELGVSSRLLERQTSVNAKVVEAMAQGALARSAATVALSVSGVLGPKPDEDGNPVGLVFFCCRSRTGKSVCRSEAFAESSHEALMRLTVITGLEMLETFAGEMQI
jgi:nicotinamide-nucleotide amidase